MKILIIEDEFYNRKALVKMIQDACVGEDVILQASNGIEALEVIKNTEIDIIFTDIRMPEMDGIQLIEAVCKLKRNIEFIVISGYAEFEYAQAALRFGVEDYLLKPVNRVKVKEILREVKKKIKINSQKLDEVAAIKGNLENERKKVFFQKLTSFLLHGGLDGLDDIREFFERANKSNNYCIISITNDKKTHPNFVDLVDHEEWCEEAHQKIFSVSLTHINGYQVFVVFDYISEEHMRLVTIPYAIKQVSDCYKDVKTYVGISKVQQDFSQMSNSYKESINASFRRYFEPQKMIFHTSSNNKKCIDKEIREQLKGLKYCIYLQNHKVIFKALESLFKRIKEEKSVELLLELEDMIVTISQDDKFDIFINQYNKDDMPIFRSIYIKNYNDLESYFLNMTNYILSVCYRNNQSSTLASEMIVNAAKIYVEDNYQESISQDSLTKDILFVNTSYFSRIFKEQVGITFSKYLKSLRLNRAKEVLVNFDYPLAQIAGMVGFNDTSYFVSSFRNQYGTTPKEFRKRETKSNIVKQNEI